ncbi:MAG: hypothetical protein SFY67_10140 [Candidatus Melainabacteria bacterium]|nr:hypothetical protein [Candidatus Melainabacteria bacterium]
MSMQPEREPYYIDYGEYREFRFFQSDYRFILTFCRHYPKVLSNKWAIVTAFDYAILLPPGVNCPKHHYRMLHGSENLKMLFDEPLPGEERRSISLENMGDRILLGIIAILLISFSVLIVCFVLVSN